MNSLTKTISVLQNSILPHVTPKHKYLFEFGVKAFTLSSFKSLNHNARCVVPNHNTAHSKAFRLVHNTNIVNTFRTIIPHLNIVRKDSYVNVDFSTFYGFQTLAFGVQTNAGRAIPVWSNCITYPIQEATSQNIFIIDQLKAFKEVLGFYPRLVFDRGFMIPDLIKFMIENNIVFYVRMRKAKHVLCEDARIPIDKLTKDDSTIQAYRTTLRLIRSDKPEKEKEPWYILTNDMSTQRGKIVSIYYYRFEID